MSKLITTDPAATLPWRFRRGRTADKVITFLNSADDTPFDISASTWKLKIKRHASIAASVLELTDGAGLTIAGHQITLAMTAIQTALADNVYYYELLNETQNKTWLCGHMHFFDGVISPASNDATVMVSLDSEDLVLSITAPSEDLTQQAVAIFPGVPNVLTLDCLSKSQRRFIVEDPIAEDFTIALANATLLQVLTLDFTTSAQVAITTPAAFSMQDFEETDLRWNPTTNILTIAAGRYETSLTRSAALFNLKCSTPLI